MKPNITDREVNGVPDAVADKCLELIDLVGRTRGWSELELLMLLVKINERIIDSVEHNSGNRKQFQETLALNILVSHIASKDKREAAQVEYNRLLAALGGN